MTAQGNAPTAWAALLELLDERMQLGLLERLRRCKVYHFEGSLLMLEAGNPADRDYLCKTAVQQQLVVFAKDTFLSDTKSPLSKDDSLGELTLEIK